MLMLALTAPVIAQVPVSTTLIGVSAPLVEPGDSQYEALGAGAPAGPPQAQLSHSRCTQREWNEVEIAIALPARSCLRVFGGFADVPGSFAGVSISSLGLLHLGEELSLSAEVGMRSRSAQFGFTKPALFGKRIDVGLTAYGQRFEYDQRHESSIFAFERDISAFNSFTPDELMRYRSRSYGATAFMRIRTSRFSHFDVTYKFDVTDIHPQSNSTNAYFSYLDFEGKQASNPLHGIQTSSVIPSYTYRTVDNAAAPTRGTAITVSTSVAGLGGDVRTIEPMVEAKYFHPGFSNGAVVAMHLMGRVITGYDGRATPPFDRYFMGGEDSVRGLNSWGASPIVYYPSSATVNVLNTDGTPRYQKIIVGGVPQIVSVTETVPAYQMVSAGGDTNVVANLEYRIPLAGPLSLVLFGDAGVNRITFPSQIDVAPGTQTVTRLNTEFPTAGFQSQAIAQAGSSRVRVSTGTELQLRLPKIAAPLRLYWAYNPTAYRTNLQAPIAFDKFIFPNPATYQNALNTAGAPTPYREPRFLVRLAIGRTF